jgi:hypothetical protein
LTAFKADPNLRALRASSVEIYGKNRPSPPPGAVIFFEGVDEKLGPMTKYAIRHADS